MSYLPRHFMVRDISQYLADTYGMTPQEAYAYNNLETAYWLIGKLPNSQEKLAFIAQIPLDAWSMIEHRVMHAWALGADGHIHHPKIQQMRDGERDKVLKRQEHARKAAMARWHPEERQQRGEIQAKSVDARASIEHETNVTTSLKGSPSRALPLLDLLRKSTTLRAREDAPAIPPRPGWAHAVDGQHRSVIKAKGPLLPRRAPRIVEDDPKGQPTRASVSMRPAMRRKRVSGDRSKAKKQPRGVQYRFERFRQEIFKTWDQANPGGPSCTWQEPDREALRTVLREHMDLTLEQFKDCLGNVAESMHDGELSPTSPPRYWLKRIVEYLYCPLDRYSKPIRKPVQRVMAPVRQL